MNILILVGSLRADSFNRRLAQEAIRALPTDASATMFNRLDELPLYNPNIESDPIAGEAVARLRAEVAGADGVIITTPAHNGSMSAVVKNAIDWVASPAPGAPIAGKRVLVLSAALDPHGNEWALRATSRVLTRAGAIVDGSFALADAYAHFSDGSIMTDAIAKQLTYAVSGLVGQELHPKSPEVLAA